MTKPSREELQKRIQGYLKRMRTRDVPRIPLTEKGLYRIISGGYGDYGHTHTLGLVNGRFIDAIAHAVQQSGFTGEWCGWSLYDNCNHGHLERAQVTRVPVNKNLNYLLSKRKKK